MGLLLLLASLAVTALCSPVIDNGGESLVKKLSDYKTKDDTSGRSDIDQYIKSSDIFFHVPHIATTGDGRNSDKNELDLNIDLNYESESEARKKSKIKKMFVPILVFVLLKAIVLIPMALGILGIKTWNAIQLSFISFISAAVLAIWKLCSKLNHQHASEAITHNAWNPYHQDRSDVAQHMAYGYDLQ